MTFRTDDEKLLEKYKTIWTKIEKLKNIEWYVLSVYYDRYIKPKWNHMQIKLILTFLS